MSLQFIIGRAGVGKTRFCLDSVGRELSAGADGPLLIVLVPEQASFQTEYALARSAGLKGFSRVQVLSFRRLAHRVLLEAGGAARAHIGELGKRMVLRRLLREHREKLKVFGRMSSQPGFADALARTLGEMKTYCVLPADLALGLDVLSKGGQQSLLTEKLTDLHLLYSALESYLSGRFTDPEDYLSLLAYRLEKASSLQKAEVWVDGFVGFTPQEYRVLAALLSVARRVRVTLCADLPALSGACNESDLFYPSRETYDTLCQIAAEKHAAVEPLVCLEQNSSRFGHSGIAYLEKNYFRRPAVPAEKKSSGVVLAVAANRRAEVEGVAREIIALCRDKGYRYRDIVVLARDLDAYSHLLTVVFADYHIPVFVDRKRSILYHPLIELVRSALEVVVKGWTYDSVFRYLKTDLVPLAREEVDLLENYVLAHGIRGSRWWDGQPWSYRRRLTLEEERELLADEAMELEEINRIRQTAAAALIVFYQTFGQVSKVREITVALVDLLSSLGVSEMLEGWSRQAEAEGLLELAQEHGQVWDILIDLLEQVVETLGDEVLEPFDYATILDTGFESMRLGLIPPSLDQVFAGSLTRSRSPEARASFVLGVNEGVLPARIIEQGILSETERESMQVVGLSLSPGVRRKVFDEQYLVYLALTRGRERLILSYAEADDEGGAYMPSPVIARVKELLPQVEEKVWAVEPNDAVDAELDFVTIPERCLSYLVTQMREVKKGEPLRPVWREVYNWFSQGERKEDCARALAGLFYNNQEERLSFTTAERLYGQPLQTSVSGIERFRSCPFAHFLAQGIRLRERAVFKLGAPDLGQFFHAALKLYGERVRKMGLEWGGVEPENCRQIAGAVVDELAPKLQSEILLSTARRRYLTGKIKRIVQRVVLVLSEHARRGKFQPVGLELSFGPSGDLPAVTYVLSDGSEMVITGRIDRVDAVQAETGVFLRVIDYKSGQVTIQLSDILHGLKLQLLTYLEVALRQAEQLVGRPGLPGAIFYFRLDDPLIKINGAVPADEALEKKILRQMKLKGLLLADHTVIKMMDDTLVDISDLIPVQLKKDGDISARSAVLTKEQFDTLRAYLRLQLVSAGNEIRDGVVDIAPYRQRNLRSCQYCLFEAVCLFDEELEGNSCRYIPAMSEKAVWRELVKILNDKVGEHLE